MTDLETPAWGIEPVPERLRVLGTFDGFLLWANLSVSLLVIVAGAFLVLPTDQFGLALSLPEALGAIVAAAFVGSALLGLGGLIGADARVPTMVLLRAPLGRRGSYLPTGLNILQCLGWSVFELIIIATGASALSKQVLGVGGVSFWKIVFGIVATALAFLGPVGFVRVYVRKFAVWIVIASLFYISWWSLHGQHPVRLWHRGGAHAFWPGFDLVLASIVSWTPLVADYTRFARSRSAGFWSAGVGYFVPTIPLFALGAVIALSRHISEAPALLTAVAAGGVASVLALLALTVDESDEAFANVYSGAVSLQNLMPRVPQRALVGAVALVATVGALLVDLRNYQPFLYLLG
ncbi:MAG TPA: cytosine permease, partial [Gaiellaceae bacterium]|nr:cytosine permease [Gaiellaceae bacterium]